MWRRYTLTNRRQVRLTSVCVPQPPVKSSAAGRSRCCLQMEMAITRRQFNIHWKKSRFHRDEWRRASVKRPLAETDHLPRLSLSIAFSVPLAQSPLAAGEARYSSWQSGTEYRDNKRDQRRNYCPCLILITRSPLRHWCTREHTWHLLYCHEQERGRSLRFKDPWKILIARVLRSVFFGRVVAGVTAVWYSNERFRILGLLIEIYPSILPTKFRIFTVISLIKRPIYFNKDMPAMRFVVTVRFVR